MDEENLTEGQLKYTPVTGIRGRGQYLKQRDKCRKGHWYAGENLVIEHRKRNGETFEVRRCRICVRSKAKTNAAKRRAGGYEATQKKPRAAPVPEAAPKRKTKPKPRSKLKEKALEAAPMPVWTPHPDFVPGPFLKREMDLIRQEWEDAQENVKASKGWKLPKMNADQERAYRAYLVSLEGS